MKKVTIVLCLLLMNQYPLSALALTEKEAIDKGLAIAIKADNMDKGWKDQKMDWNMILRNAQGEKTERNIHSIVLEMENDGDESLTIFDTPLDVKGTAFLSYTHAITPDDQWLYMPAIRRIKRISSANKSGPFMGSEFAYEDIASQEVAKFTYKWIRDEIYEGKDTFYMEYYPVYENSGYSKWLVWMDKEIYQFVKIVFFDRKGALLKTLTFHDYKPYNKRYWRADRMEMINHQTNKSTTILWSNYQLNNGFDKKDFSRSALERLR